MVVPASNTSASSYPFWDNKRIIVWVSRASAKLDKLFNSPPAKAFRINDRLLSDFDAGSGIIS
jgi:hypothetical protein